MVSGVGWPLMFAEGRLPYGRFDFGTESGNKFGMLLRAQVHAAGNQVDLPVIPGNQEVEDSFCVGLAAQTLSNQVADAVIANIRTIPHRLLLYRRCNVWHICSLILNGFHRGAIPDESRSAIFH